MRFKNLSGTGWPAKRLKRYGLASVFGLAATGACGVVINHLHAEAKTEQVACDQIETRSGVGCEEFSRRTLTQEEEDFARQFFGQEIGAEKIGIFSSPRASAAKDEIALVQPRLPDRIHVFDAEYVADDYTKAPAMVKAVFLHELAHVWQRRQGFSFDTVRVYRYDLQKGGFDDFVTEQQAALVEDYARLFLDPQAVCKKSASPDLRGYLDNVFLRINLRMELVPGLQAEFREGVKKAVEDKFPGAASLRQGYEASADCKAPNHKPGAKVGVS